MTELVIAALYKFVTLSDYQQLREPLLAACKQHDIKGTLLLAQEGINGTIAGVRKDMDALLRYLRSDARFADLEHKESYVDAALSPFKRMKVKLKKEIVTIGISDVSPTKKVGIYVKPQDWNAIISDPNVVVLDTRNEYEVQIGTFEHAINPHTDTFREFPEYVETHLNPAKNKKVAMFCTGGIRCEKASSYMLEQGFEEVYHLQGGILKYLEEVPVEKSLWRGECFVFDHRVAVDHHLQKGIHDLCFGCGYPLTEEDKQSEHYELGVTCARCYADKTPYDIASSRERQKQINLAIKRAQYKGEA